MNATKKVCFICHQFSFEAANYFDRLRGTFNFKYLISDYGYHTVLIGVSPAFLRKGLEIGEDMLAVIQTKAKLPAMHQKTPQQIDYLLTYINP